MDSSQKRPTYVPRLDQFISALGSDARGRGPPRQFDYIIHLDKDLQCVSDAVLGDLSPIVYCGLGPVIP